MEKKGKTFMKEQYFKFSNGLVSTCPQGSVIKNGSSSYYSVLLYPKIKQIGKLLHKTHR